MDKTMPDADQVLGTLQELLAERFDIPATGVTREASLRDMGLDSMMVMDVMLEIEDRFGVTLKDLALPKDPLVGDVIALIERNLGAAA